MASKIVETIRAHLTEEAAPLFQKWLDECQALDLFETDDDETDSDEKAAIYLLEWALKEAVKQEIIT